METNQARSSLSSASAHPVSSASTADSTSSSTTRPVQHGVIISAETRAQRHLALARVITRLTDTQFQVFGYRFGLDALVGLIPWIGDLVTTVLAAYLVIVALEMRLPPWRIAQMVWNIVLDFLVGSIPVLGDLFDLVYRANVRNLAILEKYAQPQDSSPESTG